MHADRTLLCMVFQDVYIGSSISTVGQVPGPPWSQPIAADVFEAPQPPSAMRSPRREIAGKGVKHKGTGCVYSTKHFNQT